MRFSFSRLGSLAVCAAVVAGSLAPAAAAGTPDRFMTALAAYRQQRFGVADDAGYRTRHVSFVPTCAVGPGCPAGTGAYLVTYAVGADGGGQALMFSKRCASGHGTCLTVVTAGGGALGERGLEAAGLPAARAQTLLTH